MTRRVPILFWTPDDAVFEACGQSLGDDVALVRLHSPLEAVDLLAEPAAGLRAVILHSLGDVEECVWAVQRVRAVAPLVPILVLARRATPFLVNELHVRRAELLMEPCQTELVQGFVARACATGFIARDRLRESMSALAQDALLRTSEVEVLPFLVGREAREEAMQRLGLSRGAFQERVRNVLRKSRQRTIESFERMCLRAALLRARPEFDSGDFDELEESMVS
jgi:hypothetical protein